ncbi:MAG: eight-cysteine-cluster domain-containing protein [Archaeoglobaceae archaeon]
MNRKLVCGVFIALIVLTAGIAGCAQSDANDSQDGNDNEQPTYTEEESKEIARDFVENSPTYQFDGYNLTHKETLYPEVVNCTDCYGFVFEFESRHAGYGNRTGEMLAQVITPHEAHVTVKNGKVATALLDMKWDMIDQTLLEDATETATPAATSTEPKSSVTPQEEFCGWSTQGNCSTDADCIAGGCSGQVCQSTFEEPVITTCEYKECYNADLYGMECKCIEGACQWSQNTTK